MANLESSSVPLQPMSVGNIVSVTINLYRARFLTYVGLAAQSVLWVAVPLTIAIIAVAVLALGIEAENALLGLGVLLIPVAIVAGVYCGVRSLACSGTISRLAFQELIQAPESMKDAQRFVRRRMWKLLLASLLLGLILGGVYMVLAFGLGIIAFVGVFAIAALVGTTGFAEPSSPETAMIFGFLGLIGVLIFLAIIFLVLFWFAARLFIYDTPITIEERADAVQTIGMSWSLTSGNVWRVLAVMTIAGLVSFPLLIVIQIISTVVQPLILLALPLPEEILLVMSSLIGFAIGLVGNLILVPIWQILKSIVYYDLKTRKEGIDLQLT